VSSSSWWRSIAPSLALVLTLTGCVPGGGPVDTPSPAAEPTETVTVVPAEPTAPEEAAPLGVDDIPAGFEQWYGQSVDWTTCNETFECATISAPLNWHDAQAGSINLELVRQRASGHKIGSLLVNPGGPGASGVDFLVSAAESFGQPVQEAFDLVGFDPRGVGSSSPVYCLDDAGVDEFISLDFPDTDAGREQMAAASAAWGQACYENTGELLGNVDTMSAARDMDLIRHLVGDSALNYLGFSYGTQLGATYAGLFPERVGRMVLDGALDITLDADQLSLGQAVGFENALRNYVTYCQSESGCPLTGSVDDGMQQISDLLNRAFEHPLTSSSGRPVNRTLVFYGIAFALYDQESWPYLTVALNEAITENRGDFLLLMADIYNDRNPDGTFASNTTEAFIAVNCVDDRGTSDPAQMAAKAAEIIAAAPTMGNFFTYGGLSCRDWPVPVAPGSFDQHAAGAPPILVIGTTNDPATPYEWAVALADTLDSGVLLTYEGEGHTAYLRSNECIADTVDDFLVNDVVPATGRRC